MSEQKITIILLQIQSLHINCEDSFARISMEHDVVYQQVCGLKHPTMAPCGSITPQNLSFLFFPLIIFSLL